MKMIMRSAVVIVFFFMISNSAFAGEPGVLFVPEESTCNGQVFSSDGNGLGHLAASGDLTAAYAGVQPPFGVSLGTHSRFFILNSNKISDFQAADQDLSLTVCKGGSSVELVFELQSPYVGVYSILVSGSVESGIVFTSISDKKFKISAVVGDAIDSSSDQLNHAFGISFSMDETFKILDPILAVADVSPLSLYFQFSSNAEIPSGTQGIGLLASNGSLVKIRAYLSLSFASKYGSTVDIIQAITKSYVNGNMPDTPSTVLCRTDLGFSYRDKRRNPSNTVCQETQATRFVRKPKQHGLSDRSVEHFLA